MQDWEELRQDVREIKADVKVISDTMVKNTASLIIHEHRTTLAEHRIARFENGVKWMLGLICGTMLTTLLSLWIKHLLG